MSQFIPAEPKRKAGEISAEFTRAEALRGIRKKWQIVKRDLTTGKLLVKKYEKYDKFLQDRDFVKEIVGHNAHMLSYMIPKFKEDKEIVYAAIVSMDEKTGSLSFHPTAIQDASESLKTDVDFVKEVREALKESLNPKRALQNFDRFIPEETLKSVEPVSAHFLAQSIREGDYELFQLQKSIMPPKREHLIDRLLKKRSGYGSLRYPTVINIEKFFVDLSAGGPGQNSLMRGIIKKEEFSYHLAIFLIDADPDIFNDITNRLRGNNEARAKLSKSITKEITYRLGKRQAPETIANLSLKLMAITHGSLEIAKNVYSAVILGIKKRSTNRFNAMMEAAHNGDDFVEGDDEDSYTPPPNFDGIVLKLLQDFFSKWHTDKHPTYDVLLNSAIKEEFVETSEFLLDAGADPNYMDENGESLLLHAVLAEDLGMIRLLCNKGADIYKGRVTKKRRSSDRVVSRTPLMEAPSGRVVNCLLAHDQDIDRWNEYGYTALQLAVKEKRTSTWRELLRRGADPHIQNVYGRTVIFRAVLNLDVEACRELLNPRHGIDVNWQDNSNRNTIMHVLAGLTARPIIDLETVFTLIMARSPDLSKLNKEDRTPLVSCENSTCRKLFIEAGAGGKYRLDRFRKLPKDCLAERDEDLPDDPNAFVSISPVELDHKMDVITLEGCKGPARCLPCRHVFSTPVLLDWVNQDEADLENNMFPGEVSGLLGLPHRLKAECPLCKSKIYTVEILSTSDASNWDKYEGEALALEKQLKKDLKTFVERSAYKQLVKDVATAEQKAADEIRGADEAFELAKIAHAAAVTKALKGEREAKSKQEEEDKKRKGIRAQSDAKQKEARDKRLWKQLETLKF